MNKKGIAWALIVGCGMCAVNAQQAMPQFPKVAPPPYPSAASASAAPSPAPSTSTPSMTQLPPPNAPVPPDVSAVSASSPAATTPIPDGYIRLQMSPTLRGQATDQRLKDARRIAHMMRQARPGTSIAGVALVDRETGQIIATFDRATLGLDKPPPRTPPPAQ